ncbi:MAG: MoaD/ThiS family protein [Sterolibacterium sp.]
MELHLGSYLSWYIPQRSSRMAIKLDKPVSLMELVAGLKIPVEEIALAAVNGVLVALPDTFVSDEDQVELHPPNGGG